jgi:hypothetical protein
MPEYVGRVTGKPFGKGSKSEHEALYLETDKGEYVLRRKGGNPFHDEVLQDLIGKTIRCEGFITDYVLLITEWTVLGQGREDRPV